MRWDRDLLGSGNAQPTLTGPTARIHLTGWVGLRLTMSKPRMTNALSEPARSERQVMTRVADAVSGHALPRLDALETAVVKTTTNAIEDGNGNPASLFGEIRVWLNEHAVVGRVTDQGGGEEAIDVEAPDIDVSCRESRAHRGGVVPDPRHGGRSERLHRSSTSCAGADRAFRRSTPMKHFDAAPRRDDRATSGTPRHPDANASFVDDVV